MHSKHIHSIAEADILTVFTLCAKTFVYSGNDDVFGTVDPMGVPTGAWRYPFFSILVYHTL